MDPIELRTLEGLLRFDTPVLELFRNDGRERSWRLHAALITAVEQERRSDRIHVRFRTTPKFYESAEVAFENERSLQELIRRVEAAH